MIDPIGLALENFDVTGAWRTLDTTTSINDQGVRVESVGVPIDARTKLYDGTALNGPASLRQAMVGHSDAIIDNLTQKLMEYALGRRLEYYDMLPFAPSTAMRQRTTTGSLHWCSASLRVRRSR